MTFSLRPRDFLCRVIPWSEVDEPSPVAECGCYCGRTPDRAVCTPQGGMWYACADCAPLFGWSLRWPSRRARRAFRRAGGRNRDAALAAASEFADGVIEEWTRLQAGPEEDDCEIQRMSVAGLHPEATCEECGRPNVTWFAPSNLWNVAVDGDRGLILCPVCFVRRAEAREIKPTAWVVLPEAWADKRDLKTRLWLARRVLPSGYVVGTYTYGGVVREVE